MYANNTFILPDATFNRLMNWWFVLLFEIEKRINLDDYKDYQERIMVF
jgi:hypothetical protein